jgi:uncharacterized protein YcnI
LWKNRRFVERTPNPPQENTVSSRSTLRLALAAALGLAAAVAVSASPAWAHVQVTADKPQAGATNVTVTFNGEAESTKAGIKSEQVFLPAGITAGQVHLGKAPTGWTFTTATDSFTVAGPALPIGTDAVWSVVIDKLPADATQLVFKTIETYGDGQVDRWITEQQAGQPEPEHPAPVLKLTAAAATSAPATTAPATTSPATTSPTAGANAPASSSGGNGLWWVVAAIVVLAVIVTVVLVMRRRRPNP